MVKIMASYIISTNFDRLSVKTTIYKINFFSIFTSTCPKYYCTQFVPVAEKFSFSNLKIEKVKFLTQDPTKISALAFFTFGDCLASCLTFRTFLTLDP